MQRVGMCSTGRGQGPCMLMLHKVARTKNTESAIGYSVEPRVDQRLAWRCCTERREVVSELGPVVSPSLSVARGDAWVSKTARLGLGRAIKVLTLNRLKSRASEAQGPDPTFPALAPTGSSAGAPSPTVRVPALVCVPLHKRWKRRLAKKTISCQVSHPKEPQATDRKTYQQLTEQKRLGRCEARALE